MLHIGPFKTGTTAIQSTLAPARDELAEYGVTYPGARGAHHAEAQALRGYRQGWAGSSAPAPPRELWQRFAGQVAADTDKVVISSEYFAGCVTGPSGPSWSMTSDQVDCTCSWQSGHPRALYMAAAVAWGKANGLEEGLRCSYRRDEPARAEVGFWSEADGAELVDVWRKVVDLDRISVLVVDEGDRALLPTTFEHLLGLPTGALSSRRPAHSNRGVGAIEAELIREVIERSDEMSWDNHALLIRGGLVRRRRDVRIPPLDEPRPMLPDWAVAQAAEEAEFIIDRLRDLGARVIGDLENLREMPKPGMSGPVQSVLLDLAVEAAAGTVNAALKRFGMYEQQLVREQQVRHRVRKRARRRGLRKVLELVRPVEDRPSRELAGILRSRMMRRVGRSLGSGATPDRMVERRFRVLVTDRG